LESGLFNELRLIQIKNLPPSQAPRRTSQALFPGSPFASPGSRQGAGSYPTCRNTYTTHFCPWQFISTKSGFQTPHPCERCPCWRVTHEPPLTVADLKLSTRLEFTIGSFAYEMRQSLAEIRLSQLRKKRTLYWI
jgi:hypothetical protein